MQRFEFTHQVKTDSLTAGLGVLYAQQQRLQQELAGFRAEVAVEFETVKTDIAQVRAEQVRQGEELAVLQVAVAEVQSEQARQGEVLAGLAESVAKILDRLA